VNVQNAFLKALAENEDDTPTRLVYADWLDEQGEHEEADRQRKWPAAKEWLVLFCRDHNSDEDGSEQWVISYEQLIELGRMAVEGADEEGCVFSCGNNMSICDALQSNSREFWNNWSVVTGIPSPLDGEVLVSFRCAC
jgi:uncharacterized protein (TIGR02996 family)